MIQKFQKNLVDRSQKCYWQKKGSLNPWPYKINRKSAHRGSDNFAQKDRKYRSSFHRNYKILSRPYRSKAEGIQKEPVVQTAQNWSSKKAEIRPISEKRNLNVEEYFICSDEAYFYLHGGHNVQNDKIRAIFQPD